MIRLPWRGRDRSGAVNPNRAMAVALGAVLAAGAVGWIVGLNVQSPADAAAARKPPPPSLVTAPVEHRILTAAVQTRGTVQFGSPQLLTLAGAVGSTESAGAGGAGASRQRVTRAPAAGQTVAEGAAVMEVNGRPVFVLTGAVPTFRTIGPGRRGRDVQQLQQALTRLGFGPVKDDGAFGADTVTAVRKWYRAKGYEPQEPTVAERQELRTLEQAVQSATVAQLQARDAAAVAGADPAARRLLDLQLNHANRTLANARKDLADYQAELGTAVPAGEVVFLPSLPVLMTDVAVKVGDSADGKIGTVTSATVVIQANVTKDDAELLRENMKATIATTDGRTVPGTLTALRDKARLDVGTKGPQDDKSAGAGAATAGPPALGGTGDGAVPLLIAPDDPNALGGQAEASVSVSIAVGSTSDKVLVVPVAAVTTGADGQSRLQVDRDGGRTEDVPVKVGLSALGYVEVTPAAGARLAGGDRVVVGVT